MFQQKNSAGHATAEKIASEAKIEIMENVVNEMTKTNIMTTKTVFRTT